MNCRGMALVTGLLLMAAVSVLAVAAAGSMTLQRHQAANFADRAWAAAGSDLAVSWAMAWLYSRADTERQPGCVTGCLLPFAIRDDSEIPDNPEFESLAWWVSNGTPAGRHPVTGVYVGFAASAEPGALWMVEELHYEAAAETEGQSGHDGVGWYRIFSRGAGRHPGSVVVTEAIVARPWGSGIEPAAFPPDQPLASFCNRVGEEVPCGTRSWRRRK